MDSGLLVSRTRTLTVEWMWALGSLVPLVALVVRGTVVADTDVSIALVCGTVPDGSSSCSSVVSVAGTAASSTAGGGGGTYLDLNTVSPKVVETGIRVQK